MCSRRSTGNCSKVILKTLPVTKYIFLCFRMVRTSRVNSSGTWLKEQPSWKGTSLLRTCAPAWRRVWSAAMATVQRRLPQLPPPPRHLFICRQLRAQNPCPSLCKEFVHGGVTGVPPSRAGRRHRSPRPSKLPRS